jgi:hypothetical protein
MIESKQQNTNSLSIGKAMRAESLAQGLVVRMAEFARMVKIFHVNARQARISGGNQDDLIGLAIAG